MATAVRRVGCTGRAHNRNNKTACKGNAGQSWTTRLLFEVISTSADLKNHKSGVQMQQPKKDKKGALTLGQSRAPVVASIREFGIGAAICNVSCLNLCW